MIIGLLLVIIILCINPFSILSFLDPNVQLLHDWCLQRVASGEKSPWDVIYSAIVCGKRLPEGELKKTFQFLGIIHLMVISGAHLIFLEKMWNLLPNFRFKNAFLSLFLLMYSMSAGMRPPVLRALFSLLLRRLNTNLKLFWSPYWRVQLSGLLCLFCHTTWFNSLSLQLSWLASMGMANYKLSRLKSCALTFILILPIVSQWGGLHPLSIVINWVITPFFSCLLLPLSLLIIPFPFLRPLTDWLWAKIIYMMNMAEPLMIYKGIELNWSLSSFQIWLYIGCVFILFQLFFIISTRRAYSVPLKSPDHKKVGRPDNG